MKKTYRFVSALSALALGLSTLGCGVSPDTNPKQKGESVVNKTLYVSNTGSDENSGTEDAPFATIERAAEVARILGAGTTVSIHAGTYMTGGLHFTEADNGCTYTAYGDGEVIINGGAIVKGSDFVRPSDEFLAKLSDEAARDKVMCVDLKNYGITTEQIGALHAIGSFNSAYKYDGDYVGDNCEVFWNDSRMTLARYPNDEYFHFPAVPEQGDPYEYPPQEYHNDWTDRRNHDGGLYKIGSTVAERVATWSNITNVWMFGYFFYDWADSSTPLVAFDAENCTVKPKFVSTYGAKSGGAYYFYNVPEEIDIPGEYYIDRENCILYVYPTSNILTGEALVSVSSDNLITAENVSGTEFKGLTLMGGKSDGIVISGVGNKITDCTVKNVAGNAVVVNGTDFTVSGCDISHTGKGGICVTGGDRITLTPSNNLVYNNCIHDWSEVYQTCQPGISLYGVGNTASHNELCNSPHEAIYFSGNDNIIEYNNIHDVVKHSEDAGAIYGGRDWTQQGNIIRYNIIRDLGSEEFHPNGVYLDDALSGITVCGNLIINTGGNALAIGGGRDNKIYDNIVINSGKGLNYDDRARDGVFSNGWYTDAVNNRNTSVMWVNLDAVPFRSEIWAEKYPTLAKVKDNFSVEMDDPDFPPNPAYVEIYNNLFLTNGICFSSYTAEYARIENNTKKPYDMAGEYFKDYENGDYTYLKPDDMPEIPISQIGRVTE